VSSIVFASALRKVLSIEYAALNALLVESSLNASFVLRYISPLENSEAQFTSLLVASDEDERPASASESKFVLASG